jgi:hypothetical protein
MAKDLPSPQQAKELLDWAARLNPGPWVSHACTAARAARTIAHACDMDAGRCHTLGLLHDIGRYEGRTALRHVLAGYELMMAQGYEKVARVCLSHSFPVKNLAFYNGCNDCSAGETALIETLLEGTDYDDEIRLVQLCDAISLPGSVTLVERRLVDVGLRHGVSPDSPLKWRAFLELKAYFDRRCQTNVYRLFAREVRLDIFGKE